MDPTTNDLTGKTAASYLDITAKLTNFGITVHGAWKCVTSWKQCFGSYEELKVTLSKILSFSKSPKYAQKPLKLSPQTCSNINQCCSNVVKYSKDYFSFDVQSEVIEAVGDSKSPINTEKLEKLLSKLNASMARQLESMLYAELVKTATQTAIMIGTLFKTRHLIRESKQYRESSSVKNSTEKIKEGLTKANNFYQAANSEINRIENTPIVVPTSYVLGQIALNLDRAKFESDCVREKLEVILRDIGQKLESISSRRTSHGVDIGLSAVNVVATAVQYALTPTFVLTDLAKVLFAANGSLHAINTIGHSVGFYWTHEEIHKLEELQHEIQTLEAAMKDSFENISYGMAKLEKMKQHIEHPFDPTLVVQE